MRALLRLFADESRATMVEYGIIAAALAVPFIAGVTAITNAVSAMLANTTAGMQTIGANPP